ISDEQNVKLEIKELWDVKTSYFHPKVVNQIADSAKKLGFSNKRMFSGAGHDANYLNQIAPTGMIFLPSVEGKSHVESELTLDKDIKNGADVFLNCILQISNMKEEFIF